MSVAGSTVESGVLLRAIGLCKTFHPRHRRGRRHSALAALRGVDLELAKGSITGLVGESGSGKSTLARCLTLLERPDAGALLSRGRDLLALGGRDLAEARRSHQLISQSVGEALNPRFTVVETVAEPLVIAGVGTRRSRHQRARETLERLGLPGTAAERLPAELSGGQRQRLVIARALVVEPELLVLDESLAGQDLSIRAQLVNLLLDLRATTGLTQLVISHDMSLVRQLADSVAVLYRGRLAEIGPPAEIFARPRHPHTRDLIDATPMLEGPAPGAGEEGQGR